MSELIIIITFILTLTALLVGFSLGKNQTVVTPDVQRKINQIFKRVVPKSDVGAVERPTEIQNYYRDNPQARQEDQAMGQAIETLNQ